MGGGLFFWGEGAFFWALFLCPPFFPSFPFFLRGGGVASFGPFWSPFLELFLGGGGLFLGLLFALFVFFFGPFPFFVFFCFFWPFPFFGVFFWCPFLGGGLFFRGLLFVYLLSVCWGDPGPVDLSKARNQEAFHDHWLVTTADTVSDQDKGGEAQLSHILQPKKTLRPDTREGTETRHTITHPITQINSQRIFLCNECPV